MAADLPTLVVVDSGEPADLAAGPAADLDRAVSGVLERATKEPPPAEREPHDTATGASPDDCASTFLEVKFGGSVLPIPCTAEGLWGLVGTAWILGGFQAVVRARQAIEDAVDGLARTAASRRSEAEQAKSQVAHAERMYAIEPSRSRASHLDDWRDVARETEKNAGDARAASRRAAACRARYGTLFRDVWKRIALAEEELLKDYEGLAVAAFREILERNRDTARREWERYRCHRADDPDKAPVAIADAAEGDDGDFRMNPPEDPAGEGEKASPLERLFWRAWDLRERARAIVEEKTPPASVERKLRDSPDEAQQREWRARGLQDRVKAFKEARDAVAQKDPILLQVYPDMTVRTSLADFRGMVVSALLAVFRQNRDVLRDQVSLTAGGQLRVEPRRKDGVEPPRGAYTEAERAAVKAGDGWQALQEWELTVPASVAIAQRLRDMDEPSSSAWVHLPVRLAVHASVEGDARRGAYAEPGSFEHAAITHLWDELEEVRKAEETARRTRTLAILAAGVVLAPFTGGGSLVAAGLVQAAYSVGEIYQAARDYADADAFARSTLAPIEAALWQRPSTVTLVRTIAARSLDVATGVIPAGRIPLVVDLALGAASMTIDPGRP